MTLLRPPQAEAAPHAEAGRGGRWRVQIRPWLRSGAFTLVLVGLVNATVGADWQFIFGTLGVCAVGFGFIYLVSREIGGSG